MAHEFIARKGLISSGSIDVSGSVTASYFVGDGSKLTNIASTSVLSSSLNIDTYTFVGNGVITNYVLSQSYNVSSLLVSVDGLSQTNILDYTLSTNTVSFVTAPPSESNILIKAFVNVAQNATGSFSGSFFGIFQSASYAVTASYAANAGSGLSGGTQNYIPLWTSPTALTSSAIYQDSASGSIGINSTQFTLANPEALLIQSINDSTYNLIRGTAAVDNYIQFNIQNISTGVSASSDIVATADNGNETSNYIDIGINGSNYAITNVVGGPNDAYLYSTGNHLHIGNASAGQDLMLFVGDTDVEAAKKLILRDTNQHEMTGSLSVLGNISGALILPTGTISSSNQVDVRNTTGIATIATTGSNTFTATQTINGNVFLNTTFPLVYNNSATNNMLFGFFDGGSIYGAYYQIFGNNYSALNQRGGAEFVYDIRNNSAANFHIASFNGSTWTEKFRVDDNGAHVTGSLLSTGGITGSLLGTASLANTASYITYANIDAKPTLISASSQIIWSSVNYSSGIVSSSAQYPGWVTASSQIDYNNIQNKLSGVVSSSAQVQPLLPGGTISSSAQYPGWVTSSSQIDYNSIQNKLSGVISSSTQFNALTNTSASFATTASYASSGSWLRNKSNVVASGTFTGNPRKATVTFTSAFPNTSYAVVVTGEDSRAWSIESKLAGSFVINSNSNTALAGNTYWIATAYGET